MLRALLGFDHCPKNVVDTWVASCGYPLTRYSGELTYGKGFIVNDKGALATPGGSFATRTLACFDFTPYTASGITSFAFGMRVTIEAVGNSGAFASVDVSPTSSTNNALATIESLFPSQAVGQSAYIEYVFDMTAGNYKLYKDNVLISTTTITNGIGVNLSAGKLYMIFALATANTAGVISIKDFYLLDNIAGDGMTSRLGPRVLVPLAVDAATGQDWSTSGGDSLLATLTSPIGTGVDYAKSPYSNTPLQLSLNGAVPSGASIDGIQLFMAGRTFDDNRGASKVGSSITYNAQSTPGKSVSLPVALTYGQNLGTFTKAPDGTLWTNSKLDNTLLSLTPDT